MHILVCFLFVRFSIWDKSVPSNPRFAWPAVMVGMILKSQDQHLAEAFRAPFPEGEKHAEAKRLIWIWAETSDG